MKRYVWSTFSLLSLAIAVCAAVVWVRSYMIGDVVSVNWPQFGDGLSDRTVNVVSGRGGLRVSFEKWAAWELGVLLPSRAGNHPRAVVWNRLRRPVYPYVLNKTIFKGLGVEISRHSEAISPTSVGSGLVEQVNVVVPDWVVVVMGSIWPVLWVRRRRRRGIKGFDVVAVPQEK